MDVLEKLNAIQSLALDDIQLSIKLDNNIVGLYYFSYSKEKLYTHNHNHNCTEVHLLLQGECDFVINNKEKIILKADENACFG